MYWLQHGLFGIKLFSNCYARQKTQLISSTELFMPVSRGVAEILIKGNDVTPDLNVILENKELIIVNLQHCCSVLNIHEMHCNRVG
ncbi:hypothetical protein Mapa_002392 [Marchantia paleacea]|nr:hypothetical protein Mapa_002392 [Marchantia paleacea]